MPTCWMGDYLNCSALRESICTPDSVLSVPASLGEMKIGSKKVKGGGKVGEGGAVST